MTDIEKFIDLYKSLGIPLEIQNPTDDYSVKRWGYQYIRLAPHKHPTVIGDFRSFTIISFDEMGKFIQQYIGE